MNSSVRLIVVTGTCAVGKSTFTARLVPRLGANVEVFHIDDYITAPPPPGYRPEWSYRRPGYLPEIGQKIRESLRTHTLAVFEGVLTSHAEAVTLARSAGLRFRGPELLTVVLQRSLAECWTRKSIEPGFQEQYPWITSAEIFAGAFYDGYLPKSVDASLKLEGAEIDSGLGVERLMRRLDARA